MRNDWLNGAYITGLNSTGGTVVPVAIGLELGDCQTSPLTYINEVSSWHLGITNFGTNMSVCGQNSSVKRTMLNGA
jgi:hypothetical protein